MKSQLFLGGTCGDNMWRDGFVANLVSRGVSADKLFNPVVPDWTPECQAAEDAAKAESSLMMFFIGNPKTPGNEVSAYSLVEAIMGLYDAPDRTVLVIDVSEMSESVAKAMRKSLADLKARFPDGLAFDSLDSAADWISSQL